jgi:glucans biosynthesis protein C
MEVDQRRYDIDWLRVIALIWLLISHTTVVFAPMGKNYGFIQNNVPLDWYTIPVAILSIWRIPLLFFVSGMVVYLSMQKRNMMELIGERTKRILLPLVFGSLLLVPMHQFIFREYYNLQQWYFPNVAHLWFLAYLYAYILMMAPLFNYLKGNGLSKFIITISKLATSPFGLILLMTPFILEAIITNPANYTSYALTVHGFALGILAFFAGFCLMMTGDIFWASLLRWRWLFLSLALTSFSIRLFVFELNAPNTLIAIESVSWMYAVFGFSYKHFNHKGRYLEYLSQGAYPAYIVHMLFLFIGAYFILPLNIPTEVKFILVTFLTFTGCWLFYEFVIRRVQLIRPIFGMKRN